MPPGETPEILAKQHCLGIIYDLPEPAWADRSIGGQFRREQVNTGDRLIVPANVPCRSQWNATGSVIAIAQMSPHYFSQLFKRSTEITPHQFVIRARVERAKELLIEGKFAIAEVAKIVGFVDQSHLHRYIERLLGVTPRMLQRCSRSGFLS